MDGKGVSSFTLAAPGVSDVTTAIFMSPIHKGSRHPFAEIFIAATRVGWKPVGDKEQLYFIVFFSATHFVKSSATMLVNRVGPLLVQVVEITRSRIAKLPDLLADFPCPTVVAQIRLPPVYGNQIFIQRLSKLLS